MKKFELIKWYFDCVTPEGRVFIGYAAKVKIGRLKFGYGAIVLLDENEGQETNQTFHAGCVTEKENGDIEWSNDKLAIKGVWSGAKGVDKIDLYKGEEGNIEWQCLKPAAIVTIKLNNGEVVNGYGYAEKLVLTVPPWKLPFMELRWGRFISDDGKEHVVWIDWRGKIEKNWIWTNERMFHGNVEECGVKIGQEKLLLREARLIRAGGLVETLFGKFSWLVNLMPRKLRKMHESKFLSRGTFYSDVKQVEGWSINEIVKWQ